ncbi:F-box/LRR-repeat protein 2 [Nymphon striatum]|nr:F-box/LRR-repeat protein 2 [Nymphon striatum]
MLKIKYTDHMTNKKVKECIAAENIQWAEDFAKRKLKFAGHIIRGQDEHKLARLVMEGLVEGKKDRGRQRRVWGDDLKEWSKSTSIGQVKRQAENRDVWKKMVHDLRFEDLSKIIFVDDESNINKKLPKELLLRIFSYLDVVSLCRCAQVSKIHCNCKHVIMADAEENRCILYIEFITNEEVKAFAKTRWETCCTCAKHWKFVPGNEQKIAWQDISDNMASISTVRGGIFSSLWNILALDGSNWQRIDLFNFQTDVEGSVIENISRRCGGFLKKLSLYGCKSIGDDALRIFAEQCNNIEELNLNGCKNITDDTCKSLSEHCCKLTNLHLGSCINVTNKSLKSLSEGCPVLEHLNISWCNKISEDGVEALAHGCPKIKTFRSIGCNLVNDEAVRHLTSHCHFLEDLDLHSCDEITDASVIRISKSCPRMLRLCVSKCPQLSDASLLALANGCLNLRTLEVSGCSQFSDGGFQALAKVSL